MIRVLEGCAVRLHLPTTTTTTPCDSTRVLDPVQLERTDSNQDEKSGAAPRAVSGASGAVTGLELSVMRAEGEPFSFAVLGDLCLGGCRVSV